MPLAQFLGQSNTSGGQTQREICQVRHISPLIELPKVLKLKVVEEA